MIIYRLLTIIFSPLIFNHVLWKSFRLKETNFLVQRLGFNLGHIPEGCLWFHCASVGETLTIISLINELHKRRPKQNFLITTNTATGAEIVKKQSQQWLFHSYLPADWVSTTKRFLRKTKPAALCIVETELWPNLVNCCYSKEIPVCIINGRLSTRTTSANNWIKSIYRKTLNKIEHIYVRSEIDRSLYMKLGADENKISILGNLKFIPPDTNHIKPQQTTQRDYVVIASSHEGEELELTNCWNKLNRDELLVIAPRHPERSEAITRQLAGSTIAVRSKNDAVTDDTQIYLLDTVGELTSWFEHAKLIIMAGSFIHRGGHNILEPAHFGKAIVFGPHMESFEDEVEVLLSNKAAIQADSIEDLNNLLPGLLDSTTAREQLQNNAAKAVEPFGGILSSYADVIEKYL